MVAEAQRRNPEIEFREGDAEQLPLGDDLFDAAMMNYYARHYDEAIAGLREVLATHPGFGQALHYLPVALLMNSDREAARQACAVPSSAANGWVADNCRAIVAPKVLHFRQMYAAKLKKG